MAKKIQELSALQPEAISLLTVLAGASVWVLATPGPLDRFGTLKGTDFSQFYVASRLVVTGHAGELYDWATFARDLAAWVPGPSGLLYFSVYPPATAVLLSPLGLLSYLPALAAWTCLSAACYVVCGAVLVRHSGPLTLNARASYLLLAGFPAWWQLLLFGQISALVLALLTLAWIAWRSGRTMAAGIALGALVLKPPMLTVAIGAILLLRGWPLAFGVIAGGVLVLGATAIVTGPSVIWAYGHTFATLIANPGPFEPKPEQIQSLRGFVHPLLGTGVPASIALIGLAALAIVLAERAIRRLDSRDLEFAIVILVGALLNPHLYVYDLVVLILPLGLICAWLLEECAENRRYPPVALAARGLYWLPLVAPVLGHLHLQLTAPVMTWLLWAMGSAARARPTPRL